MTRNLGIAGTATTGPTINKVRNRFKILPSKCAGLLAHGRVEHGSLPQVDGPFETNEGAGR